MDILDLDYMLQFRNMFEINYSQLIQYEILEKLVTYIQYPVNYNTRQLFNIEILNF